MRIDAALNLIWATLAIASLGCLVVSELRRPSTLPGRLRRVLAVLVAAVALFPTVSVSDDFARFGQLQAGLQSQTQVAAPRAQESNDKPAFYLARLAEALESLRISAVRGLLVMLCFFAFVRGSSEFAREQALPSTRGRGPPNLSLA